MTYPHITDKLERKILAAALNTFRQIPKRESKTRWLAFASMTDDYVFDEGVIDAEIWKLKEVNYNLWMGKKRKMKTITL